MPGLRSRRTRWLMAVAAIFVTGCGSGPTAPPGIEPEIINATDNFQYQVSAIQDYTGSQAYTWQNTGTTAVIDQSAAVTGGSATLVLRDANGVQVYSRSLAEDGTFSTSSGAAGTWTIRVIYNHADATVNFRADKAD